MQRNARFRAHKDSNDLNHPLRSVVTPKHPLVFARLEHAETVLLQNEDESKRERIGIGLNVSSCRRVILSEVKRGCWAVTKRFVSQGEMRGSLWSFFRLRPGPKRNGPAGRPSMLRSVAPLWRAPPLDEGLPSDNDSEMAPEAIGIAQNGLANGAPALGAIPSRNRPAGAGRAG